MSYEHPTGPPPTEVIMVGGGYSRTEFLGAMGNHDDPFDGVEVWGMNTGVRWLKRADMFFVMDDMDLYGKTFPSYGKVLSQESKPILTSAVYPDFPSAREYPLREVCAFWGPGCRMYFHDGTGPYMLAYAGFIGVQKVRIFGFDYHAPTEGASAIEKGRSCTEFWCGMLVSRGVVVDVAKTSILLNQNQYPEKRIYGYLKPPRARNADGVVIGFNNQTTRPDRDRGLPADPGETPVGHGAEPHDGSGHREWQRPALETVPGGRAQGD